MKFTGHTEVATVEVHHSVYLACVIVCLGEACILQHISQQERDPDGDSIPADEHCAFLIVYSLEK